MASLLRAIPNSQATAGLRRGRRERLGGQVGRDLRIADTGEEVAQHAVLVAAVEGAEGGRLSTGRGQQPLVGRVVPHR